MSKQNKSVIFVLATACVLGTMAGGSYLAYTKQQQAEAEALRQAQIAQKLEDRKEIQALFDTYLNDMITELKVKIHDYRQTKAIIADMISPYNFENPTFAQENLTLFQEDIAPNLRDAAGDTLAVFEKYEDKLHKNLEGKDGDIQASFKAEWQEMKKEQLDEYVAYFTREDSLLDAYEDLLRFYYAKSNFYTIDLETDSFVFKRAEDEAIHKSLLEAIDELKQAPTQKPQQQSED